MTVKVASTHRPLSIREQVTEAEWSTRVELAALYRALARWGMTDHIYNHITHRVPGEPTHFLLNAFGMTYPEVTASSLYKIDIDGNVVLKPDNPFGINPAAFVIHSAIHRSRHDLNCVMHIHTRATMAVSVMEEGLLPLTQQACMFDGKIGYHDFYGPVVDMEEQKTLVSDLGDNKVMMLRNHGALVCGATIPETFLNAYFLEVSCKVQVDAMRSGAKLIIPSDEVLEISRRIFKEAAPILDGSLEWKAMLRMLDADGADYAD